MISKHSTKRYVKQFILLLYLVIHCTIAAAAPIQTDSIQFSLITCAPGEKIYTLFGHTAIRYQNFSKDIDDVFNYGLFSFSTPNFIWRFVKGETDYRLGVIENDYFELEYKYERRTVWQQTLNLTTEEKSLLLELLLINRRSENSVYRYNFLYDNCATRPRDKIEEAISGEIIYQTTDRKTTFREIIHQATQGYPWERFGMDFCLGVKADRLITYREEMFAPLLLMNAFANATVTNKQGEERQLVSTTTEIITGEERGKKTVPLTPIHTFLLLFILITATTIYGIRNKKTLWGLDVFLFTTAGLAGCVIAFLTGFSEHPAVSPNYLIFIFHPLHLLLLPFFIYKERKGRKSYYHLTNCIVLTFFILVWPINPQYFDLAVLPLALCLLIRSASHLVLTYKKEK